MEAAAIYTALTNLGGAGLVAAAIFYLHLKAIDAFRQEIRAEREANDRHVSQLVDGLNDVRSEVAGMRAALNARGQWRVIHPDGSDRPA